MFPIFSFVSQNSSNIRKPDDIIFLSQELFPILISLEPNIEANDKLPWISCIELKNSIIKMAADFPKQGFTEESFTIYHKYLTHVKNYKHE